jgi:hypothetical protein
VDMPDLLQEIKRCIELGGESGSAG